MPAMKSRPLVGTGVGVVRSPAGGGTGVVKGDEEPRSLDSPPPELQERMLSGAACNTLDSCTRCAHAAARRYRTFEPAAGWNGHSCFGVEAAIVQLPDRAGHPRRRRFPNPTPPGKRSLISSWGQHGNVT